MKIFSKDATYKEMVDSINEKLFSFKDFILPKENREEYNRVIHHMAKDKCKNELNEEDFKQFFKRFTDVITDTNTKFQTYVYSSGGNKTATAGEALNSRVNNAHGKTEYFVCSVPRKESLDESFKINDEMIILEAVGQKNNATYIGKRTEGIEDEITKLGRDGVLNSKLLFKVTHDPSKLDVYDLNSDHLINLIKYCYEYPDEVMQSLSNLSSGKQYQSFNTFNEAMKIKIQTKKALQIKNNKGKII